VGCVGFTLHQLSGLFCQIKPSRRDDEGAALVHQGLASFAQINRGYRKTSVLVFGTHGVVSPLGKTALAAKMSLVRFVRDSDDTADRGSFLHFHVKLLRLIVHSDPPKLADEMNYFYRWKPTVVLNRDLSTLQIGVHHFPPSIGANVNARAIPLLAVSDID
jgi:hypothetical protein